jgi:hypothetical protein
VKVFFQENIKYVLKIAKKIFLLGERPPVEVTSHVIFRAKYVGYVAGGNRTQKASPLRVATLLTTY